MAGSAACASSSSPRPRPRRSGSPGCWRRWGTRCRPSWPSGRRPAATGRVSRRAARRRAGRRPALRPVGRAAGGDPRRLRSGPRALRVLPGADPRRRARGARGTGSSTRIPRCCRATAAPTRWVGAAQRRRRARHDAAPDDAGVRRRPRLRPGRGPRGRRRGPGRGRAPAVRGPLGAAAGRGAGAARGRRPGDPQDEAQASYAGVFEPEYVEVDWSRPAREVHNQTRAWKLSPPVGGRRGPLTELDGRRVRLVRTSLRGDHGGRPVALRGRADLGARERAGGRPGLTARRCARTVQGFPRWPAGRTGTVASWLSARHHPVRRATGAGRSAPAPAPCRPRRPRCSGSPSPCWPPHVLDDRFVQPAARHVRRRPPRQRPGPAGAARPGGLGLPAAGRRGARLARPAARPPGDPERLRGPVLRRQDRAVRGRLDRAPRPGRAPVLLGLGRWTLWTSRRLDAPLVRRYGRRALKAVGVLVVAAIVARPDLGRLRRRARRARRRARRPARRPARGRDAPHERRARARGLVRPVAQPRRRPRLPRPHRDAPAGADARPPRLRRPPLRPSRRGPTARATPTAGAGTSTRTSVPAWTSWSTAPTSTPARIGGLGLSVGGEMLLETAASTPALAAVVAEGAGARTMGEEVDDVSGLSKVTTALTYGARDLTNAVLAGPPPAREPPGARPADRAAARVPHPRRRGRRRPPHPRLLPRRGPAEADLGGPGRPHPGHRAEPAEYERRVVAFFDRSLLGR